MCPFIVSQSESMSLQATLFIALTTALPDDAIVDVLLAYAQSLVQQKKSVLIFDASLGLGDLTQYVSTTISADEVLMQQKPLSCLLHNTSYGDIITGQSRSSNLGAYNFNQLQQIFRDLKLLGKNYDVVIVYAPASLPKVQDFFCNQLKSVCIAYLDEEHLSAITYLHMKYPKMMYYISSYQTNKIQFLLQLELSIGKKQILSHFF